MNSCEADPPIAPLEAPTTKNRRPHRVKIL
jgi:hypothetical protein